MIIVVLRLNGRFLGFLGKFDQSRWGLAGMFCNAHRFECSGDVFERITDAFERMIAAVNGDTEGYSMHPMSCPDIRIDDYDKGQQFRDSLPMYL